MEMISEKIRDPDSPAKSVKDPESPARLLT